MPSAMANEQVAAHEDFTRRLFPVGLSRVSSGRKSSSLSSLDLVGQKVTYLRQLDTCHICPLDVGNHLIQIRLRLRFQ